MQWLGDSYAMTASANEVEYDSCIVEVPTTHIRAFQWIPIVWSLLSFCKKKKRIIKPEFFQIKKIKLINMWNESRMLNKEYDRFWKIARMLYLHDSFSYHLLLLNIPCNSQLLNWQIFVNCEILSRLKINYRLGNNSYM